MDALTMHLEVNADGRLQRVESSAVISCVQLQSSLKKTNLHRPEPSLHTHIQQTLSSSHIT